MLREFFNRHQKTDIGTQTEILPWLISTTPSKMIYPALSDGDEEHYHFPPPPEPAILYSDKFCELTSCTLKILHFPGGKTTTIKEIPTSTIKKIYFQDQESFWDCYSVAIFGIHRKTLWAWDNSRYRFSFCCSPPPSETNIVVDAGLPMTAGFTVENGPLFTSKLKEMPDSNIEFFEGLP